jgi:ABC-type sulfate transport system permease subunit
MHVSICTKDSIEILRAAALAKGHLKRVGQEMAMHVNSKYKIYAEQSSLSKQDILLLLLICTDLVNLCVHLTGKIDPAAAVMLAYVRDDIFPKSKLN